MRLLLEACMKASDEQGCKAVLEKLSAIGGTSAACYNMLISNCAKQGQTAEAEAWMRRMLEAGVKPDAASFNSTIDAWARAGDVTRAEQWLAKVAALGVVPDTVTCNAVIDACACSARWSARSGG